MKGENKTDIQRGSLEAADPFSAAPPGISLTSDNKKWPWGQPAQDVDVNVILEKATDKLDNDPLFLDEMFKLLVAGISIEHIVEAWVIDGFESGKFSLDAGMLAKSPLAIYIAYLAEEAGVPYKMFEKDDPMEGERMDDEDYLRLLKQNNPPMFASLNEKLNEVVRNGGVGEQVAPQPQIQEQPEEGFISPNPKGGVA